MSNYTKIINGVKSSLGIITSTNTLFNKPLSGSAKSIPFCLCKEILKNNNYKYVYSNSYNKKYLRNYNDTSITLKTYSCYISSIAIEDFSWCTRFGNLNDAINYYLSSNILNGSIVIIHISDNITTQNIDILIQEEKSIDFYIQPINDKILINNANFNISDELSNNNYYPEIPKFNFNFIDFNSINIERSFLNSKFFLYYSNIDILNVFGKYNDPNNIIYNSLNVFISSNINYINNTGVYLLYFKMDFCKNLYIKNIDDSICLSINCDRLKFNNNKLTYLKNYVSNIVGLQQNIENNNFTIKIDLINISLKRYSFDTYNITLTNTLEFINENIDDFGVDNFYFNTKINILDININMIDVIRDVNDFNYNLEKDTIKFLSIENNNINNLYIENININKNNSTITYNNMGRYYVACVDFQELTVGNFEYRFTIYTNTSDIFNNSKINNINLDNPINSLFNIDNQDCSICNDNDSTLYISAIGQNGIYFVDPDMNYLNPNDFGLIVNNIIGSSIGNTPSLNCNCNNISTSFYSGKTPQI